METMLEKEKRGKVQIGDKITEVRWRKGEDGKKLWKVQKVNVLGLASIKL